MKLGCWCIGWVLCCCVDLGVETAGYQQLYMMLCWSEGLV